MEKFKKKHYVLRKNPGRIGLPWFLFEVKVKKGMAAQACDRKLASQIRDHLNDEENIKEVEWECKQYKEKMKDKCRWCGGTGKAMYQGCAAEEPCRVCDGTGKRNHRKKEIS